MKEMKRPELAGGLTITTLGVLVYIVLCLFNWPSEILSVIMFWISVVILLINIKAFYTVNLSAKDFKKQMVWPWISFSLILIYIFYKTILILFVFKTNGNQPDALDIAICVVFFLALILYILGILKRIVDGKISYEEHLKQTKNKK